MKTKILISFLLVIFTIQLITAQDHFLTDSSNSANNTKVEKTTWLDEIVVIGYTSLGYFPYSYDYIDYQEIKRNPHKYGISFKRIEALVETNSNESNPDHALSGKPFLQPFVTCTLSYCNTESKVENEETNKNDCYNINEDIIGLRQQLTSFCINNFFVFNNTGKIILMQSQESGL